MPNRPMNIMKSRCACGGVEYEAIGAPITSAICYCASCQEAGHAFEQLPAPPAVLVGQIYRLPGCRSHPGATTLPHQRGKVAERAKRAAAGTVDGDTPEWTTGRG